MEVKKTMFLRWNLHGSRHDNSLIFLNIIQVTKDFTRFVINSCCCSIDIFNKEFLNL